MLLFWKFYFPVFVQIATSYTCNWHAKRSLYKLRQIRDLLPLGSQQLTKNRRVRARRSAIQEIRFDPQSGGQYNQPDVAAPPAAVGFVETLAKRSGRPRCMRGSDGVDARHEDGDEPTQYRDDPEGS
jgi:hypothetical protein